MNRIKRVTVTPLVAGKNEVRLVELPPLLDPAEPKKYIVLVIVNCVGPEA